MNISSGSHCQLTINMKGREVLKVKLTTLYMVSPVASSLLIGSDVHLLVFTVIV